MEVIIGVDPHKASHTAVAIDDHEVELAQKSVRASRTQVERLLAWAEPFEARTWAIEGADGIGLPVVPAARRGGERVVDVPATLAARTRVLGSGRSNKTDPNDARSVAVTALRHDGLHQVRPVGHTEVLRLLAKRNTDIGDRRTQVVARMHSLLVELAPGGIAKEINASDVDAFLAGVTPRTRWNRSVTTWRSSCSTTSVASTRSSRPRTSGSGRRSPRRTRRVTDLFGIGPVIAAELIGYTGDISRFADRDHYAAYNGTAPVEFSSGGRPSIACRNAATVSSTTRCTWPRSASSATHTPTAAPTSTARSPTARPRRKRSAR